MARNAAGNYSLPSGNPVVSGSTIQSSWANTTLSDLSVEVTDSLSRSGKGGMLAALALVNGTVSIPAVGFSAETASGLYRNAASDVRLALGGTDRIRMKSASGAAALEFTSPQAAAGTATDFEFQTVNNRTAGSLFKISTGVNERFRIDNNGDIFKNGVLFSGSGGTGSGWTSFFLTADATVGTTATDLSGMSFAMEANSKYVIRAILIGLSGDALTYGLTFVIKGIGAPSINNIQIMSFQDDNASTVDSQGAIALDQDWYTGSVAGSGPGSIRTSWGIITTAGTAGTFQLQGRRTAGTANPAVRAGSYIEYHKVV